MLSGPPVWATLYTAEAARDLEFVLASFADDAEVNDHAARHATGAAQIRQWLEVYALPEFREHVVGTLQVAGDRVTWVDRLANRDGSTQPVQVTVRVQDSKIRTFLSTGLGAPVRSEGLAFRRCSGWCWQ